jgi:hypothetical protein
LEEAVEESVVPYVVDFSGTLQRSIPRPFYCSTFDEDGGEIPNDGKFSAHDWYFFSLPNRATIPAGELYFSPEWSWDSNAGR